jgi:threonine/homoserine/homoserine lactone efflux protein
MWPVEPAGLAPFALTALLLELTPGPNMGFLLALSANRGRAAGFACVAGVTVGLAICLAAAVAVYGVALSIDPDVTRWLRIAGGAFLFWMAAEAWFGAETSAGKADGDLREGVFVRGLLTNLLNPKAWVFYAVLLPAFVAPDHADPRVQATIFGAIHLIISVAVHAGLVIAGAGLASLLGAGRRRSIARVSAVAIAAAGIWLILEPYPRG